MTWEDFPFAEDSSDESVGLDQHESSQERPRKRIHRHCPYGTLGGAGVVESPASVRQRAVRLAQQCDGDVILDLGCGGGGLALHLVQSVLSGSQNR